MLHRQREEISSPTSDAEHEVTELQLSLKESQIRLSSLRLRESATDEAILSAGSHLETFLRGFRRAAMPSPVTAQLTARAAYEAAAPQPPPPAAPVAYGHRTRYIVASRPSHSRGPYGLQIH